MTERHPNERLAVLEHKVAHMETTVDRVETKVDEIHDVLLQAKGFKMPFVILGTVLIGTIGAVATWLLSKLG